MKNTNIGRFFCIFVFIFSILISFYNGSASSSPSSSLLGIAPQDEMYFKTDVIKCKDGSKKFTRAQLNDNFCDCPDGTDEPGTSACPRGKFYCRNAGHLPVSLFSSRVNDGICDCCDGSDEYDGTVNCPNTCWEAGQVARDELRKKIAMYQEGLSILKRKVEKAERAFEKDKVELSKLKNEEKPLKKLVKQLEGRKQQIEKYREKESQQKKDNMKETTNEEDKEEKDVADNNTDDEKGTSEASDGYKVELLDEAPQNQHERDSSENSELSREDLGRLVASRWTGEKTDDQSGDIDISKDKLGEHDKTIESVHEGGNKDHANEQANTKYGEDGNKDSSNVPFNPHSGNQIDSDTKTLSSQSWWDKILETIKSILQSVNLLPTPVDMLDADRIRKEYDKSSKRLSDIESKISSLTEKIKHDFGSKKEFYSFYDRCYEIKHNKYVYKVCPFKQASQEDDHSATRLGEWEKFEDSYSVMLFSNGDGCWNGPRRSLKVMLRCGLKTELTSIDEPSRCEYLALMSTPVLCREEKLKELENELDSMNKEKPQGHDEL